MSGRKKGKDRKGASSSSNDDAVGYFIGKIH